MVGITIQRCCSIRLWPETHKRNRRENTSPVATEPLRNKVYGFTGNEAPTGHNGG